MPRDDDDASSNEGILFTNLLLNFILSLLPVLSPGISKHIQESGESPVSMLANAMISSYYHSIIKIIHLPNYNHL